MEKSQPPTDSDEIVDKEAVRSIKSSAVLVAAQEAIDLVDETRKAEAAAAAGAGGGGAAAAAASASAGGGAAESRIFDEQGGSSQHQDLLRSLRTEVESCLSQSNLKQDRFLAVAAWTRSTTFQSVSLLAVRMLPRCPKISKTSWHQYATPVCVRLTRVGQ